METIKGDVITKERKARNDVAMIESERGGVSFQTNSYIDVLLDTGTITKSQAQYGRKYWSLREVSQRDQDAKTSRLDYISDTSEDELPDDTQLADDGVSGAMYMVLIRLLAHDDYKAINACCYTLSENDAPNRMKIYHAFNENTLIRAFNNLERLFPKAEEEAIIRVEKAEKDLQAQNNLLVSLTDTCVKSVSKNYQPA